MGAPYNTPAGISKPHSLNHWDSTPPLPPALLHSGSETQGPASERPSLSLPTASVFPWAPVTRLCTTGSFPISYPTPLVPLMPSCRRPIFGHLTPLAPESPEPSAQGSITWLHHVAC